MTELSNDRVEYPSVPFVNGMRSNNSIFLTMDKTMDYIPIVSTASNLIDIFNKAVFIPVLSKTPYISNYITSARGNSYTWYIQNEKSYVQCFLLLIPILGILLVTLGGYVGSYLDERTRQKAEEKRTKKLAEEKKQTEAIALQEQNATKPEATKSKKPEIIEELDINSQISINNIDNKEILPPEEKQVSSQNLPRKNDSNEFFEKGSGKVINPWLFILYPEVDWSV
jgi:hypothetical protein